MTPGGLAPPGGGSDRRPEPGAAPGAGDTTARTPRTRTLAVHAWGDGERPKVVCLHGVTSWGGHFAELATRLSRTHDVVAPDLLGHGSSPHDPPWRIEDHLAALDASVDDGRATWIGHSFGGRLALERAARRPETVERLVLLDPVVVLPPHVAQWAAENARVERRYDSFAEALDRRYDESELHGAPRERLEAELAGHLVEHADGWRYRYAQASVVTAYSEMATPAPSFDAIRVPTLVVLGADSYLPYDLHLDAHRAAAGELLDVVRVAGGHTVLWDAFEETAEAIERFLG